MQPSRTSHVFDGNDWPMPPVQWLTSWPSKSSCQPCARSSGVSWLGGVLSGVWALALTGKRSKANARHGRNQRDCIERKRQYTRTPASAPTGGVAVPRQGDERLCRFLFEVKCRCRLRRKLDRESNRRHRRTCSGKKCGSDAAGPEDGRGGDDTATARHSAAEA